MKDSTIIRFKEPETPNPNTLYSFQKLIFLFFRAAYEHLR